MTDTYQYALDDEDVTYDADARAGMPTVWASEHAAVVAERDALRDTVRKLAEARAEIAKQRDMYIALVSEHDPVDYVTVRVWKAKGNALREILDLLPTVDAEDAS